MSGVVIRQNRGVREKSLDKIAKYKEQIEGKKDIIRTWEKCGRCQDEHPYIMQLQARIRTLRTRLQNIKP